MKKMTALAALLAAALALPASAATIVLTYDGSTLLPETDPDVFEPASWPAFDGQIVLDESQLGGSVAGRTLSFFGIDFPGSTFNNTDGIVSWTHGIPLYSVGGTTVNLTFDAGRNLTDWYIDALDGPPDLTSRPTGDFVFTGLTFYSAPPGTWTTAVVPLPAAALGLGGALGLLLAAGRRRKRRA